MGKIAIALVLIVLIGIGAYFLNKNLLSAPAVPKSNDTTVVVVPVTTPTNTNAVPEQEKE